MIGDGKIGWCGVRKREGDKLIPLTYGRVSSIHPDPIEKKPLYHFMPGSATMSLGSIGCSLGCQHCQNWSISQTKGEEESLKLREVSPEEVIVQTQKSKCPSIALTYNEPTIWFEYARDIAKLAHENDIKVVFVTNGYVMEDPAKEIGTFIDAANIDVKAFTEDFYKDNCYGKLEPVLRTAELWFEKGIHIELTYLVIKGYNDSENEIRKFSQWITNLSADKIPVHFSRFFPHYQMDDVPPTPVDTIHRAREIAQNEGLKHVYVGNVINSGNNTLCANCNATLVKRTGFSVELKEYDISKDNCRKCGTSSPFVGPVERSRDKRWWQW